MYLNSKMAVFAMSFILSGSIYASTALENTALNRIQNEKAPEHAPLSLVKDGVAQAVVVIPESSGPKAEIYRRSADELIRYIEKATGAKLEIFEENKPLPVGKKLILIGESPLTIKYGISSTDLPLEGFRIKTFPEGLAIVGRMPENNLGGGLYAPKYSASWGVLFGVYDFLERFCGVRWYYPDDLGIYIPRIATLSIPPFEYSNWPNFSKRSGAHWSFFRKENPMNEETGLKEFSQYFRAGDSSYLEFGAHSPINFGIHATVAPECMEQGKDGTHSKDFPCYGNPKTVDLMYEDLVNFYEKGDMRPFISPRSGRPWCAPSATRIMISPPDKPVSCNCEFCKNLWRDDWGSMGSASIIMTEFVSKLASRIHAKWPEKKVLYLPYLNYMLCPDGLKLPENVVIQMTKMYGTASAKEELVAEFYNAQIRKWNRACDSNKIVTWEYSCWPAESTFLPFQYPHTLQKFYQDNRNSIYGSLIDGHPSQAGRRIPADSTSGGEWAYSHPTFYIWYRLLWDPDFNVDAALDEYCSLMYGAAAPEMKEILGLLTNRWEEVKWREKIFDNTVKSSMIYGETMPKAEIAKLDILYQKGLQAASKDPLSMQRLEFFGGAIKKCLAEANEFNTDNRPTMLIKKVGSNPNIDGKDGDKEFLGKEKYFTRLAYSLEKPGIPPTSMIRAVWTDDGITFAILNYEAFYPAAKLTGYDARIYEEDCIELFIQPENSPYFHVAANHLGGFFDERGNDPSIHLKGLKVASSIIKSGTNNHWFCEIFIPFSDLGIKPLPNTEFSGNIIRNRIFEHNNEINKRFYRWFTKFRPAHNDTNAFGKMKLVE
jgi:hypothetical protein